jgi:hypothetical protein
VCPRSRLFQVDRAGPQLLVGQHGAAVTYYPRRSTASLTGPGDNCKGSSGAGCAWQFSTHSKVTPRSMRSTSGSILSDQQRWPPDRVLRSLPQLSSTRSAELDVVLHSGGPALSSRKSAGLDTILVGETRRRALRRDQ